ncbi:glycosyltransferase family 25 protein [Verrucomicrobium sp. BvORR034]|uniref:glycosyltransferase family 25 protein n=1 Tax=Verrucomicrobium sp. BvORR034 TaxID=1396418 RepID=UPI000AE521CE|nr:glycosyltransferase family 25 protein [Verrucomicrobium sp. BvORR034]
MLMQKCPSLSLTDIPVYIINLEESRERWAQCFRRVSNVCGSKNIQRIPAIDGSDFSEPAPPLQWNASALDQLRREGHLTGEPTLDPVRTALCLSHQRALTTFLHELPLDEQGQWALILEDDARPAEWLLSLTSEALQITVPADAELLFLHDRVLGISTSMSVETTHHTSVQWRTVTGGYGLEAYLVTPSGARKMLQAWRPLHFECDVQLMTFARFHANPSSRQQIWQTLHPTASTDPSDNEDRLINCYTPHRPLFQSDELLPSVKQQRLRCITHAEGSKQEPSTSSTLSHASAFCFPSSLPLAFATSWFNPCHYRSRLENFLRFRDAIRETNLLIVELAFNDDDWQLPDDTPNLIRLRTNTVCWQKEALLNHGLKLLHDQGFAHLGWLDADIIFESTSWQERLLEELQTKRLCQAFETVNTTFPDRGHQREYGAAASWIAHSQHPLRCATTGFGWAMHREVWNSAHLYDHAIVGGSDKIMWNAIFHDYLKTDSIFPPLAQSADYQTNKLDWATRWSKAVQMKIGFNQGVHIRSLPHGHVHRRQYGSRDRLLVQHVFEPTQHLSRDAKQLLQWRPNVTAKLRQTVAEYFASRKEDAST